MVTGIERWKEYFNDYLTNERYNSLLPLPELPRGHALHSCEETGEGGDFSKMELFGYLGDAHRGLTQKKNGLHQKQLVDVVNNGATT